jgi:hypothetical protein
MGLVLVSEESSSQRDQGYLAILRNLPLEKLEEILLVVEKSIKEYLDEKLKRRGEYTIVASISRGVSGVDLTIDLRVNHCITPREKCSDIVSSALSYARRRVEEYLENLSVRNL